MTKGEKLSEIAALIAKEYTISTSCVDEFMKYFEYCKKVKFWFNTMAFSF